MKRFENEVKTFKNGSKRDEAKMQTTLRDLGLSGWKSFRLFRATWGVAS